MGEAQKSLVDREAVKVLAIAVGVREAARRLNLSEDRVRQWSSRGEWFKDSVQPSPLTKLETQKAVVTKVSPSQALQAKLRDDSDQTRIGLSKATRRAAKVFAGMEGERVIAKSEDLRRVVSSAAQIHSWEEKESGSGPLNLNLLGGRAVIQVNQA